MYFFVSGWSVQVKAHYDFKIVRKLAIPWAVPTTDQAHDHVQFRHYSPHKSLIKTSPSKAKKV